MAKSDKLTAGQIQSMRRHEICEFYAIDPDALTMDLIELDADGQFRRCVTAYEHLYAADGEQLATERSRFTLGQSGYDADRSLAARMVREAIGIKTIVSLLADAEGGVTKTYSDMVAFAESCHQARGGIKTTLNYSVKADPSQNSPMKLAGELLGQIGLTMSNRRSRFDGQAIRVYELDRARAALMAGIAERRYQRRIEAVPSSDPHPSGIDPEGYGSPTEAPSKVGGAEVAAKLTPYVAIDEWTEADIDAMAQAQALAIVGGFVQEFLSQTPIPIEYSLRICTRATRLAATLATPTDDADDLTYEYEYDDGLIEREAIAA
jgi:hypothetical protein